MDGSRRLPGSTTDLEITYSAARNGRGTLDVVATYDDGAISAERDRVEELIKKELDEVTEELANLSEEEKDDSIIFAAQDAKARRENQETHRRLDADLAKQRQKISASLDEYADKRAEYLAGNFCSGCGKTRSEILATESEFPHPNQVVRSATPAELERLKTEYDRRIAQERDRAVQMQKQIDDADFNMRRRIDDILLKKKRAQDLRENTANKLHEEQKALEQQRETLLNTLTELGRAKSTTRITLMGNCKKDTNK